MRKPNPSRFVGQRTLKPDKLEMKGFSSSLSQKAASKNIDNTTNRTKERSKERPNDRTDERTTETTETRVKVRHTFDIFEDQLRALQARQLEAVQKGKKKPKMGDMVQQAIDLFLESNQGSSKK